MFEVIIIGAGVIGCSIAYHLAKNGCWDVVVLEREIVPQLNVVDVLGAT